jgi:glutamate synthase (NADPH/NADH) small chain
MRIWQSGVIPGRATREPGISQDKFEIPGLRLKAHPGMTGNANKILSAGTSDFMGKITGFLEIERHDRSYAPVTERVKHFKEFVVPLSDKDLRNQASRCMNCGIPYCHGTGAVAPGTPGCPVNNQIPDFNDLVYQDNWEEAARNLHSTNNFPEFTGRICPAPCEASCTLNIDDNPVTIKTIECAIVDRAFANGWVKPEIAATKTGRTVAIVGSGPAGLACAQQLARAGHDVHVYEKFAKAGGLLRYGIPDFKMEKHIIDRRIAQIEAEGVTFHYGVNVGGDLDPRDLLRQYDAVALTGGAEAPRDLPIPGRELAGIHFAMDFLPQQNRRVSAEPLGAVREILATDKHVVVIGGGDTGSDCIGTSFRQGAKSVTQLEIMPAPPEHENKGLTWPNWPLKMRTSSSQAEGAKREFAVLTEKFSGHDGKVGKLHCVKVDDKFKPLPGTEFVLDAELVLLAMGFVHPVHEGLLKTLGVDLDPRGNVRANTNEYRTSLPKVFSAGDMRRGQSLVVWAIREGRLCARSIDQFLTGTTNLPR